MIATRERPVTSPGAEALIDAMRKVERNITHTYGPFTLFGLFERESIPGRWDLVVSAPWLPEGREGIQIIANYVARLPKAEAIQIARIVPLAPESTPVRSFTEEVSIIDKGVFATGSTSIGNAEVVRGYILVSQKGTPIPQPLGKRG